MKNLIRANKLKIIFAFFFQLISLGANATQCKCTSAYVGTRLVYYMDCGPHGNTEYPSHNACIEDLAKFAKQRRSGTDALYCVNETLMDSYLRKVIHTFRTPELCEAHVRNAQNRTLGAW